MVYDYNAVGTLNCLRTEVLDSYKTAPRTVASENPVVSFQDVAWLPL